MKKLLFLLPVLLCSVLLTAQVIHDANAEVRSVSGFKGINVSSSIDLYISQGSSEAVAVSAKDTKVRERIITEVKDGILHISVDSKLFDWNNFTRDQKMKAYVTVKDINRLQASGASDIHLSGVLKTDNLKMDLSGASDFEGEINAESLQLHCSGASDVKIRGRVAQANIKMSGASDIKGYDLSIDYCKIDVNGASDVQLTVNKELDAEASGASSIRYKGEASVKRSDASGASSIKKKA